MPRLTVVFDANAYRSISQERLATVMSRERSRGVVAGTCYPVVQELLGHLASPEDPDYGSCWHAVGRLVEHCKRFDGRQHQIEFAADVIEQIVLRYWRIRLEDLGVPDQYADLLGAVVDGRARDNPAHYRTVFSQVGVIVREHRSMFVEGIDRLCDQFQSRIATVNGSPLDMQSQRKRRHEFREILASSHAARRWAASLFYQQARSVVASDPTTSAEEVIESIASDFATPIHFLTTIVAKAVLDGMNLRRRESLAFDTRISFLASEVAQANGIPARLVTDDGAIREAAAAAGMSHRLQTLDEYITLLHTDVADW